MNVQVAAAPPLLRGEHSRGLPIVTKIVLPSENRLLSLAVLGSCEKLLLVNGRHFGVLMTNCISIGNQRQNRRARRCNFSVPASSATEMAGDTPMDWFRYR